MFIEYVIYKKLGNGTPKETCIGINPDLKKPNGKSKSLDNKFVAYIKVGYCTEVKLYNPLA